MSIGSFKAGEFGKMGSLTLSAGGVFVPTDDSNLLAWYDPSAGEGTGYDLSAGDTTDIYDLSGNGNDLAEITTGFVINSADQNGLDTFGVTADRMEGTISGTNNQPWTIGYVFKYTGTSDNIAENIFTNSAGGTWAISVDAGPFNNPPAALVGANPGSGIARSGTVTDTGWHIIFVVMDGADTKIFIDGTTEDTYNTLATDVTQTALANLRWGLGLTGGSFGDVILIGGDASVGSNFENYFNYLNNKWAIV